MDKIIKKIEEMKKLAEKLIVKETQDKLDEIQNDISTGYITACDELKEFIQSSQKEPVTIGDKIRESNESLAEFINKVIYQCVNKSGCGGCRLIGACRKTEGSDSYWYLDYLNQPSNGN